MTAWGDWDNKMTGMTRMTKVTGMAEVIKSE